MANQEPSGVRQQHPPDVDPTPPASNTRGYSPGIVATVIVVLLVVGLLLKAIPRVHQTTANPPLQTTGENISPPAAGALN
jgi:hypothetical protein